MYHKQNVCVGPDEQHTLVDATMFYKQKVGGSNDVPYTNRKSAEAMMYDKHKLTTNRKLVKATNITLR